MNDKVSVFAIRPGCCLSRWLTAAAKNKAAAAAEMERMGAQLEQRAAHPGSLLSFGDDFGQCAYTDLLS